MDFFVGKRSWIEMIRQKTLRMTILDVDHLYICNEIR